MTFDESRVDPMGMGMDIAASSAPRVTWQEADRALRRIAKSRARLDAEEARWLLIARATDAHVGMGFASFAEYIERVLGHGPRVLADRLRVAEALESLPAMADALGAGRVCYSAVRELTRVATPATEEAWLAAAANRTVRDIESMVAGHAPGDLPTDPADPELRTYALRFQLAPEVYALFRDARRKVCDDAGEHLDDEAVLAELCRAALRSGPEAASTKSSRPPYQICVTTCSACQRGWQDGGGQAIEVSKAVIDEAGCDATAIGRVDGDAPAPVTASIPRRLRNQVMRRDHQRCVVPGCRSSRHLAVHHLDPRARGGGNDPANLVVLCGGHHTALHRGHLVITGRPGALGFSHADGRPWGAPPPAPEPALLEDLRQGLRGLGLTPVEARSAVETARAHVGTDEPPEAWLRAALASYGERRRKTG